MSYSYLEGDVIEFDLEVRQFGRLVDPTTLSVTFQVGSGVPGSAITFTGAAAPADNVIGRDSVGRFRVWFVTTGLSGTVTAKWVATGTGQCVAIDTAAITGTPF